MKIDGLEVVFVTQNKDGNWYVGYKVPVQRGIRGKTKGKVDELLIVGMHNKRFKEWCDKHGLVVVKEEDVYDDE